MQNTYDRRSVWLLIVSWQFHAIPLFILETVTIVRLSERGVNPAMIGAFAAVSFIAVLAVVPFVTTLSKWLNERTVAHLSAWLMPIVAVSFTLSDHLAWWFLCELMMGISFGLRWVLSDSWVNRLTPATARGRSVGVYETLAGGTIMVGPALVAATQQLGTVPFLLAAVIGVVNALLLMGVQPPADRDRRSTIAFHFLRSAAQSPALMVAAFTGGVYELGATAALPVYGLSVGFTATAAALLATVLGVGSFLAQGPLGGLADRYAPQALLRLCILSVTVAAALLPLTTGSVPWIVWLVAAIWGGLGGGTWTLTQISIGSRFADAQLTSTMAAGVWAYTAGAAIGPLLSGAAMSISPQLGLSIVFVGIGLLALWILARATDRTASPVRSDFRKSLE
jgi:MFS family permease